MAEQCIVPGAKMLVMQMLICVSTNSIIADSAQHKPPASSKSFLPIAGVPSSLCPRKQPISLLGDPNLRKESQNDQLWGPLHIEP